MKKYSILASYCVICITQLKTISTVYQTNNYNDAKKVLDYFNENKSTIGFSSDEYKLICHSNTNKIIDKILN